MGVRFKGIYAPLTTPFRNEAVYTEKLKENIQKYNVFDLAGYVISGSTAESVYLEDDEVEELVISAKEVTAADRHIIVGTAKESTKLTLEFSKRMEDLGIDATLIRTPSYFKALMTPDALKKHFFTIADNIKAPLIIYHIPRFTGVNLSADLLCELSKHENIAGIKDSSGNMAFLDRIIPHLDPNFDYLLGAGSMLFPGILMGACGGVLALSDVATSQCIKLYQLSMSKQLEEAKKLQHELVPLNQALTVEHGIPAIKYALDQIGFFGGPCRLPLQQLDSQAKEKIDSILSSLQMIPE
jgi:4-hydroxy-2-oxoglutarate aldolase